MKLVNKDVIIDNSTYEPILRVTVDINIEDLNLVNALNNLDKHQIIGAG